MQTGCSAAAVVECWAGLSSSWLLGSSSTGQQHTWLSSSSTSCSVDVSAASKARASQKFDVSMLRDLSQLFLLMEHSWIVYSHEEQWTTQLSLFRAIRMIASQDCCTLLSLSSPVPLCCNALAGYWLQAGVNTSSDVHCTDPAVTWLLAVDQPLLLLGAPILD